MKSKAMILAVLLTGAAQAQADGFRPWGDVVAKGAGMGVNLSQGRVTHELGFQPFLETQHRVMDALNLETSVATMAFENFGFRPWADRS